MYDPERELLFEVEVMLGVLDESHIIRTIEYWDIERQRYPVYDHRAVIVAEEITARLFNVIRLLNRAVPLIAIQLNALTIGEAVVLHFTKVLDVHQETEVEDELAGGQVDRRYWEKRASTGSLAALDKIVALTQSTTSSPRVTYNTNHIALDTTGSISVGSIHRKRPGIAICGFGHRATRATRSSKRSRIPGSMYVRSRTS